MKPAQLPAAREVVMRRTDDVQVVIEPARSASRSPLRCEDTLPEGSPV